MQRSPRPHRLKREVIQSLLAPCFECDAPTIHRCMDCQKPTCPMCQFSMHSLCRPCRALVTEHVSALQSRADRFDRQQMDIVFE